MKIKGRVPSMDGTGRLVEIELDITDPVTIEKIERGLIKDLEYYNQFGVSHSSWEEYRDSERQKSRRTIPFEAWRNEGPQGEIRV
jgi:hypothetical protein